MDPISDANGQLNAAILNFLESQERGVPVDRSSLLADHPAIAAELRDFLDTFAWLERLTAPVRYVVQSLTPHPTVREATPPVDEHAVLLRLAPRWERRGP